MGATQNLIEKWWGAFENSDWDTVRSCIADNATFTMPGADMVGVDQILGLLEGYKTAFPDLRHNFKGFVESGESIAVELEVTGTHTGPMVAPTGDTIPATGKRVVWQSCDVITTKGGKVTSWHVYFDNAAFLTQLGLMPEMAGATA